MTCEDRESEGSAKITEEGRTVLEIVRRVLRDRTDWIAQGQVLMEEIVAGSSNTRREGSSRTSSPGGGRLAFLSREANGSNP
jgi:hypothetical protein